MITENIQAFLVLAVIAVAFVLIYRQVLRPPITLLLANLVFLITGILSTEELLEGLANESIISILLLILLTAGIRKNFQIEAAFDKFYRRLHGYRSFLLAMMAKVALVSSVMNNTPVVAAMTPYVFNWGRRNHVTPSKLLIPLSYATICGGMITLIGTSTTLVLNGFMTESDLVPLDLGKLLIIGLSVTAVVILFIVIASPYLLPDRQEILAEFNRNQREYLLETKVTENSPLNGKTVSQAGLRQLKGVFLVEIIRKDDYISPVGPDEKLQSEDILIFAGDTGDIMDLVTQERGLTLPQQGAAFSQHNLRLVEVVVSSNSNLIGKKVMDSDFRSRYNAAIVAIHRNGEILRGKIGEIRIHHGDLLLLFAGPKFHKSLDLYRDLYLVSDIKELKRPSRTKVWSLGLVALTAFALLWVGHFSLFSSLLIVIAVMASLKMISMQDLKREVDINLLAILVFSLALGTAVINTGAGELMAQVILDTFAPWGSRGVLLALLIVTTLLTSFISNVGAVAVCFPIAFALSSSWHTDSGALYLAIAFAASAAFLTPIGYQTNLIVYGPGGYNFRDFFKIGLPVTLVYLATVYLLLIWLYPEA